MSENLSEIKAVCPLRAGCGHSGRMLNHPRTGQPFESPVPPGTGWPGDPATPHTPPAADAAQVVELAGQSEAIDELDALVSVCRACPRLVDWREHVAVTKRKSFADQPYWGRPVPGWGSRKPKIVIVGLAPAANGANRTGRMFTGDRSGDQLYAALYRAGLVNQPTSVDAADGLHANGIRITAPVRCAPPDNAPSTVERNTCAPWLDAEWQLIAPSVRVIVALGGFAWQIALRIAADPVPKPKPKFGHGVVVGLGPALHLVGCYHPSQQNMFTGRLTPAMLDDIFAQASALAGLSG